MGDPLGSTSRAGAQRLASFEDARSLLLDSVSSVVEARKARVSLSPQGGESRGGEESGRRRRGRQDVPEREGERSPQYQYWRRYYLAVLVEKTWDERGCRLASVIHEVEARALS